jgi:ABC-type xylose transport system substrate-binding protein
VKKITTLIASVALGISMFASQAIAETKGVVGISMPTKTSTRWISDGETMEKLFKDAGYEPDLQFADDDIPNQLAQIENMVTKGAKVLVIGAIDGTTLSDILQKAADAGVKVIAYDRLIRDSGNVDYYATFDNFQVGVLQATSLVDGLKAKSRTPAVERRTVRRFAGRQQRLLLLRRRHVDPAADDRQRRNRREVGPAGHGTGRYAPLGRHRRPGAHGKPAVLDLHRRQGQRRSVAL